MLNKLNQLNRVGITSGSQRGRVYGLRFRDGSGDSPAVNDLIYERTGSLSGFAPLEPVPDIFMPVHSRMRRCVLDGSGTVAYYLDAENSMWRAGDKEAYAGGSIAGISIETYANALKANDRMINGYAKILLSDGYDQITLEAILGRVIRCSSEVADVYGVVVDYDATEHLVTIGNPHCVLPPDLMKYEIGTAKLDGTDGNVMVEIPGFWYRYSTDGNWQQHDICLSQFTGARYIHPMYISAFEGVAADASGVFDGWTATAWDAQNSVFTGVSGSVGRTPLRIRSVAGFYPDTSMTRAAFRSLFTAEGTNYHQYDYTANWVLQLLILIECGSFYVDNYLGLGISDVASASWNAYNAYNPIRRTGDTIPAGNRSWDMYSLNMVMPISTISGGYRIQSLSYRGIENPYGGIWKWVDGVNMYFDAEYSGEALVRDFARPHVCPDPSEYADDTISAPYVDTGDEINTHWAVGDPAVYAARGRYTRQPSPSFYAVEPILTGGSSSTYMCDYMYVPSTISAGSYRVLAVGGAATYGRLVGPWCVILYGGSGSTNANVGGRLCYSPR